MEVERENLHMLETKAKVPAQVVLEGDINLSEQLPDMSQIYLSKAQIVVEELQPAEEEVVVRGYVKYQVLYYTKEEDGRLEGLDGKFPMEERIHVTGLTRQDEIRQTNLIEDLNVLLVNSRKLAMRLAVTFEIICEQVKDAHVLTKLPGCENVEIQYEPLETASLLCCKQDIIKVRKEITLEGNQPCVEKLLWTDIRLQDMQERCEENLVKLSGMVRIQSLYQGENLGQGCSVVPVDFTIPLSEGIECMNCKQGMIPCCSYHLENESVHVLPDLEGEQRILLVEATICLRLKVYEICHYQAICQAYSTKKELVLSKSEEEIPQFTRKVTGKQHLDKKVTTSVGAAQRDVFQLLCFSGELYPLAMEKQTDKLMLRGFIEICALLVTSEDEMPFTQEKISLPYEYCLEVEGLTGDSEVEVESSLEALSLCVAQDGVLEIQATTCFAAIVSKRQCREQIVEITEEPIDPQVLESMPSMLILRVEEGEDLWSIGKRYYMSVDDICTQNHLEEKQVTQGQKLILLRN